MSTVMQVYWIVCVLLIIGYAGMYILYIACGKIGDWCWHKSIDYMHKGHEIYGGEHSPKEERWYNRHCRLMNLHYRIEEAYPFVYVILLLALASFVVLSRFFPPAW